MSQENIAIAVVVAFVVLVVIGKLMPKRAPKEKIFRCSRCKTIAMHNDRTIEAWRGGKTRFSVILAIKMASSSAAQGQRIRPQLRPVRPRRRLPWHSFGSCLFASRCNPFGNVFLTLRSSGLAYGKPLTLGVRRHIDSPLHDKHHETH